MKTVKKQNPEVVPRAAKVTSSCTGPSEGVLSTSVGVLSTSVSSPSALGNLPAPDLFHPSVGNTLAKGPRNS